MTGGRTFVKHDRHEEQNDGDHDEWGFDPRDAPQEGRGHGDRLPSHDTPPDEWQREHEPAQDEEEEDADVAEFEEGDQTRVPGRAREDRPEGWNDHESAGRQTRHCEEMDREHDAIARKRTPSTSGMYRPL